MANVIGKLPQEPRRNLLGSLAATISPVARQKAAMEEGVGIRRLVALLECLPDHVTVIIQPKLGWMMDSDCCVIGADRVLVISAMHWKGRIVGGENEEWRSATGVDLGRPDRRAAYFAKRLAYSGHAADMPVEPVVVFTDGPVDFHGPAPVATLVNWDEAYQVLAEAFPAGRPRVELAALIKVLGGGDDGRAQ